MIKTKTVVDSIGLFKLKISFQLKDECYYAESELTPIEFDSDFPLSEQYDWFDMAVKMAGVSLINLKPKEFKQLQDSLEVDLLHDERLNVLLN